MSKVSLSLRRLPVIILAALLVISTGCQASGEQSTSESAVVNTVPVADLPAAPAKGAQAPDFTLTDLNGDEVSLGDLRGQPVLLNFWATW
jgi:cytochrome oxidase Cu insertion factor (SCO1/SenC/PrrC family)